jgi:hypothetical protein
MNQVAVILKDTSMAPNVSQSIGNNATIAYTNATSRGHNALQHSQLMVFLLHEPSVQQQLLYKGNFILQ